MPNVNFHTILAAARTTGADEIRDLALDAIAGNARARYRCGQLLDLIDRLIADHARPVDATLREHEQRLGEIERTLDGMVPAPRGTAPLFRDDRALDVREAARRLGVEWEGGRGCPCCLCGSPAGPSDRMPALVCIEGGLDVAIPVDDEDKHASDSGFMGCSPLHVDCAAKLADLLGIAAADFIVPARTHSDAPVADPDRTRITLATSKLAGEPEASAVLLLQTREPGRWRYRVELRVAGRDPSTRDEWERANLALEGLIDDKPLAAMVAQRLGVDVERVSIRWDSTTADVVVAGGAR